MDFITNKTNSAFANGSQNFTIVRFEQIEINLPKIRFDHKPNYALNEAIKSRILESTLKKITQQNKMSPIFKSDSIKSSNKKSEDKLEIKSFKIKSESNIKTSIIEKSKEKGTLSPFEIDFNIQAKWDSEKNTEPKAKELNKDSTLKITEDDNFALYQNYLDLNYYHFQKVV